MREFIISENDSGQRLNKFLLKAAPHLPASLMQKYLRLKRIKVNGARAQAAYRLQPGGPGHLIHRRYVFCRGRDRAGRPARPAPAVHRL